MITQIQSNPELYSFPKFCFEKDYRNYLFLDSAILITTNEAEEYFFSILKNFEKCIYGNEEIEHQWELLIPRTNQARYRPYSGEWSEWKIERELKLGTLREFYEYFMSFFNGSLQSHFTMLVDEFWMALKDKVGVYVLCNCEIIIIGIDTDFDLSDFKNEEFTHFFYQSFDEYVDHWGPYFRWTQKQIHYLKSNFLSN